MRIVYYELVDKIPKFGSSSLINKASARNLTPERFVIITV